MSRTLYYAINISEVHGGLNTYPTNTYLDLGNGMSAPGIAEWHDAGTVNWTQYFNNNAPPDEVWAHYTVSTEILDVTPDDYGTKLTYDTYYFGNHLTAQYPKWGSVQVPDSFVIPSNYDNGNLAGGWVPTVDHTSATSGDFSWSGISSAVYNGITLSASQANDTIKNGLQLGVSQLGEWAAQQAGLQPLWDAVKRDASISSALTTFVNNGTDTLTQLMNGFQQGMTPAQADAILQNFLNTTSFEFHQTAGEVLGIGTGLDNILDKLLLAERLAVNPTTGVMTNSKVMAEDSYSYFGQYAQFSGDPSYRNDIVLAGDSGNYIDTGDDTSITPNGQRDFVASGAGADTILTYQGSDVIAAGYGRDSISAGAGNDYIDGGAGVDTANFTGLSSQYTIVKNSDGSFQVTDNRAGSPDGSDHLISVEQLHFTDTNVMISVPQLAQDFAGTGKSEILLENSSGALAAWTLKGHELDLTQSGNITYNGSPMSISSDWHHLKLGSFDDFFGDGSSDILWQNTNGQIALWRMNGNAVDPSNSGNVTLNGSIVGVSSNWHFQGSGDFFADGSSDLLWRSDSGELAVWSMNGKQIDPAKSGNVTYNGSVMGLSSDWHFQGTGEFTGDGRTDVLWRNDDGRLAVWAMNGKQLDTVNSGLVTYQGSAVGIGSDWHMLAVADLDGNGTSDALWRNDNGLLAYWTMNGKQLDPSHSGYVTYNGSPVGISSDWHFGGVGDFAGDGSRDLLWFNDNGTTVTWEINGNQIDPSHSGMVTNMNSPVVHGSDWHIL